MEILIVQILNSIFQAASLFLLAAGLSLIYGVMRIVNLAHGNFYAFGAYVTAWTVGVVVALAASYGINLGVIGQLLLLHLGALAVTALGAVIQSALQSSHTRKAGA